MYSLTAYGKMLTEPVRCQAYLSALETAIQPGCVVLEIGTGPGAFALYAARSQARKVYAIEPDASIQVARELAVANGLSERIEFFQGLSTEIDLPEKADLIFSDLRGLLPLYQNHLLTIVDARDRLLAPGGTMIPMEDSLWACVVTAEDIYHQHIEPWGGSWHDLDLSLPRDLVTNSVSAQRFTSDQCLLEPRRWAVLDYHELKGLDVSGQLCWEASRAGQAHGLAVWFDTRLTADIGFSNAPGQPELIYGQSFFPFRRAVALSPGDRVDVDLRSNRLGEDYIWSWKTSVQHTSGKQTRFEQSTFHGVPLAASNLEKLAANHVPELSDDGELVGFILGRIDGKRTQEEIARALQEAYPCRFGDWRDALQHVVRVAEDHC